jgi:hypothetical protein
LKLMVDSTSGPQQYKFSDHEIRSVNPRHKGKFSFTLTMFEGRAVNNIKSSALAQDLLSVLKQSAKAVELTGTDTYEFMLDKNFVFHVTRPVPVPLPEVILES